MGHYLVDERDIKFVLFDWLNIGKLAESPKFAEVGFDADAAWAMIQTSIKVAQNAVAPCNEVGDKVGVKFENGKVSVPPLYKEAFKAFVDNGFLVLNASPRWGGMGWPAVMNMQMMEFFCGACTAFTMYPELTVGAARMFDHFASEELKQKYLPNMYAGIWGGTMCLTEPGAGSDVGAVKTSAKRNPDGTFQITGTKIFISSGDHDICENIIHPVLARIEGAEKGVKGISLFIVPKILVNDDGSLGEPNDVVCGGVEHKMGIKGSATCTLNFGENGKCKGWLVGEENEGIKYMFMMMNEARLYVGLQAASVANTAWLNALKYAKERIQFRHVKDMAKHDAPGVPIIEHPDVRRMLMFCKSVSEGLRALLARCAMYEDLASISEGPAKDKYHGLVELMVPICKAYSSDMAYDVTEQAIQVFGGYGFCQEYPVEQYARDTKITSLYEGTNGIQALDLLGRKLTTKGGVLLMYYMQELAGFIGPNLKHPVLGELVAKLQKAQEILAGTAMSLPTFMKRESNKEKLIPILYATPFLEMFGHVMVAHQHLEMAVKAQSMLEALYAEKGATAPEAQKELLKNNAEAQFLWNKVQTAKWFVNNILPHAKTIADYFKTGDTSAFDIRF